jgi:hypothetical protein
VKAFETSRAGKAFKTVKAFETVTAFETSRAGEAVCHDSFPFLLRSGKSH